MNTDNSQDDQILDETILDTTQNEQETTIELSVEEQLTQDLAAEKDKFIRLLAVLNKSIRSLVVRFL